MADGSAQLGLNAQETDYLDTILPSWTSKSRTEKAACKEEVISKFLKDRGIDTANAPMRFVLRVKIGTWFSNHAPASEPRLPRSLRAHWTGREVFYEQEAERIQLRIEELKEAGTHPIAALNKARSQLWNELSDEEKDGYTATADTWTAQGPDQPELRAQIAEKRGPGWSHGYADLWYTQAHAVGLHLFFYLDKNGRLKSGHYDTSQLFDDPSVKQFTELYPNWHKNIFECLGKYAATVLLPDDDDNTADPPPVKANTVVLEFYDDGTPILPDQEGGKPITLVGRRQTIMRAYMNANYSAARQVPDSSVPWARLKSHPADFFDEGLIPEGVELGDPAHMRAEHLDPLWNRIIKIQASEGGEERFRFRQYWDAASKRYFKTRYPDEDQDESDGPPAHLKKGKKAGKSSKRPLPPGLARLAGAASATAESSSPGSPVEGGGAATGRATKAALPKKRHSSKGKKRARDSDEESARFTDPELPKDGEESSSDGEGQPLAPKPKPKPKPRPARRARLAADGAYAGMDTSDHGDDAPDISQLGANAPLEAASRVPIPPASEAVARLQYQAPCAVRDPQDVFPYLWALAGEREYRELLKSWRHMLLRPATFHQEGPGPWASWSYTGVSIPAELHATRKDWDGLLFWLRDFRPQETSSASDVQQWFLAAGMALRDIHTRNSCEEGESVPYRGAAYMPLSPSTLEDSTEIIEPTCLGAFHPSTNGTGFSAPPSSLGGNTGIVEPFSVPQVPSPGQAPAGRAPTVKGSRRGPPGLRQLPQSPEVPAKSPDHSASEVEDVIVGNPPAIPSADGARVNSSRPKPSNVPYVLLPALTSERRRVPPPMENPVVGIADAAAVGGRAEETIATPAHAVPAPPGGVPAAETKPAQPQGPRRGERTRKAPKRPDA